MAAAYAVVGRCYMPTCAAIEVSWHAILLWLLESSALLLHTICLRATCMESMCGCTSGLFGESAFFSYQLQHSSTGLLQLPFCIACGLTRPLSRHGSLYSAHSSMPCTGTANTNAVGGSKLAQAEATFKIDAAAATLSPVSQHLQALCVSGLHHHAAVHSDCYMQCGLSPHQSFDVLQSAQACQLSLAAQSPQGHSQKTAANCHITECPDLA